MRILLKIMLKRKGFGPPGLTDLGQSLSFLNRITRVYAESGERAGGGSVDDGIHLHGFQRQNLVAGLHGGASGHVQGNNEMQRSGQHHIRW